MATRSEIVKKTWITRRLNGNDKAWNKGLTMETDERVLKNVLMSSKTIRNQFKNGKKSYIRTPETTKKNTESKRRNGTIITPVKKGSHLSKSHRAKISVKLLENKNGGESETHWNWQGGITPINAKIRNSKKYKEWREKIFKRDNWICQNCNVRGGQLEADHIKPFAQYPKLRFEVGNGRTLCKKCHKKIGWQLFKDANPRKKTS